jgi:hypothetical protein
MTRRQSTILLALFTLLLTGCAAKYSKRGTASRSRLRVVVFAADADRGRELLEQLAERGYDNEQNHVGVPGNDNAPAIRWGAASSVQIADITGFIEGRYGVELARMHDLEDDDYSVIITLPGGTGAAGRDDLRVVIFTDDKAKGDDLLERLRLLGYSNDENYVTDDPNDDTNIKWGIAGEAIVDEITAAAVDLFDVILDRQHTFEPDDHDVFINLPFGASTEAPEKSDFEITVFCDSTAVGQRLLARLAELGYSSEESEVIVGPNDDCNIKYGALPEDMVEEVAGELESLFNKQFRRSHEFEPDDHDVFINVPLE